jgi:deoxyribodipyrimidine photolyase-related protein
MHKIPRYFWEGKTQIEILNTEIHKLKVFGYSHHIVRLMLFGNIMVLC